MVSGIRYRSHALLLSWKLTPQQPEFAHPYDVLAPHTQITIASPAGGEAPLDPSSVEATKDDKASVDFLNSKQALWKNTEKLSKFVGRAKEFDAVFFVGGHGRKSACFLDIRTPLPARNDHICHFVSAWCGAIDGVV